MGCRITFSGYTDVELDVDVDDVLESLDDDHIIEEAKDRGLAISGAKPNPPFLDNHKDNNRRKLCELLEMNMHTSKEEIINELKTRL